MALGTDKEILEDKQKIKQLKAGRPEVSRELAYKLIGAGTYSTQYMRRVLHCSSKTISNIRKEMIEKGVIASKTTISNLDAEARDFETELRETMGFSFIEWLQSKTGASKRIFNFCKMVWTKIWNKVSLYEVKDINSPVAHNIALQFLSVFGEDTKRLRNRKKIIRFFFRYMGRSDINDQHLTMNRSRDPPEVRNVPEIAFEDFPLKLDLAIKEMGKRLGAEASLVLKLKLCTQMRTGAGEREMWGIRCGEANGGHGSYLIMDGDNIAFRVHAKGNETWDITWIPKGVREELLEIYKLRAKGEKLVFLDVNEMRSTWKEVTLSLGLPAMSLHDLRKVSITWLWAYGIPLEIATSLNCGWRDLNTAKDHYLTYRRILTKDKRIEYLNNIPSWFKEGLDQYV